MSTLEILFLALVCGAFGVFSVCMIMVTMKEKSYARAESQRNRQAQH
jgi:hypothetical protein